MAEKKRESFFAGFLRGNMYGLPAILKPGGNAFGAAAGAAKADENRKKLQQPVNKRTS
jgi:hypothetical protein